MEQDNGKQTRPLRVGAVQMSSEMGKIRENLSHALPLVEQAAGRGAEIVILPEMAASGYTISKDLWAAAEPRVGYTARWLGETAKRLGIYLGAGFVEAEGADFYNSYLLADPGGRIAGLARKRHAEFQYLRGGRDPLVVPTALGKIGIGICADTHYADVAGYMMGESIDLMLMPHAWMTPYRYGGKVSERDLAEQNGKARDHAAFYAGILGVPAVFANHVGSLGTGYCSKVMPPELYDYPGFSAIADGDASVKAALGRGGEGVIVADVSLDPARKRTVPPKSYEGLLRPRKVPPGKIKWPMSFYSTRRKINYLISLERRAKARAASAASLQDESADGHH